MSASETPDSGRPPQPAAKRGAGPRWDRKTVTERGFSPHFRRYVPGLGMLNVLPQGDWPGAGFTWALRAGRFLRVAPGEVGSFPGPEEAMTAANRAVSAMEPGLFAGLTLSEAQELFRRLARARPLRSPKEEDGGPAEIETVRRDLHWHLEVLDLDPDAGPHTPAAAFTDAAITAGQGAWLASLSDTAARRPPAVPSPARRRAPRTTGGARPGQGASPAAAP